MRKRVLIVLSAVVGLLLLVAVGVFVWYRTGGLDRWFEGQLRSQLAKMNVRTEVDKTTVGLRPGSVVLENLRLYPGDETLPAVSVDRVTVKFDVTSLLAQTAEVKSLELARPVVTVRFDESGRSNLDAIKWPEPEQAERPSAQLSYQLATVAIADGEVHYGDATRKLDGTLAGLKLAFGPKGDAAPGAPPSARRLDVSFADSRLVYDGRELASIGGALGADVTGEGATVDTLNLDTPAGTVTASGTVRNWDDPEYDFRIGSTVSLERVGYVADPNAGLTGRASLNGRLYGKGSAYHFDGDLAGNDVLVAGVRVADVSSTGRLQGERLDYAWVGRLIASRVVAPGLDASGLSFDGKVEGRGAEAALDGSFHADRVAASGAVATGIDFRGRASAASLSASGDVAMSAIAVRTVRAGSVRAKITADGDRLDVPSFSAVVYGGSVSGSARAELAGGGRSSLEAEFRGVDLDRALGASSPDAPRVSGKASGKVLLAWPGANLRAATGKVTATVDGSVPNGEGGEAIPVNGDVALTAVPGSFRVDRAEFTSGASSVSATGSVGWNRQADLDINATAERGEDLLALVTAANPSVGEQLRERGVAIAGAFSFKGNVRGAVANPSVTGAVSVGDVRINDESLGAFTADVRREGGVLALSNARLALEGGGEIAFDVALPSATSDAQTVRARVTRYPLASLLKTSPFPAPLPLQALGGLVSGDIDLTIPREGGFSAATGRLALSVEGAKAGGEDVRELRFAADLGPDAVSLTDLRFATASGALTGTARYEKGTGVYRADFDAKDVDLAALRGAGAPPGVALSGRANGTLAIAGAFDAKSFSNRIDDLAADVTGTDVAANGQALGSPHVTVTTREEGGKKVADVRAVADVRGARREVAALLRLEEPGTPFEASAALDKTDVARLAGTAPEGVTTSVTGAVTVKGRLDDLLVGSVFDHLDVGGDFSELRLDVSSGDVAYSIANRGQVRFKAVEGVLRFEKATFTGEGTELTLAGDLAIRPEAASNLTLSGDVNLALLSTFSRDAFAGGVATLSATVAGTLADPKFSGYADVRDASLRVIDLPIAIQNGNGRIRFTSNQALIDSFTAQSNGGRVRVDGGVLFAGLKPDRWRFGIDAEQIRVSYPQDVRSVVDGRLTLQGNSQLQVLAGNVDIRRAEYTTDVELTDLISLDESGAASFSTGTNGVAGTSPIRLDLTVDARDSIVVRNNLADVVASASLVLTGPSDAPVIDGRATITRGTINFRNGEYQVTRGVARFPGRLGDVTFDLQAESEIRGYRVSIGLSGTPAKPYPVLRSEPALPETQIISLILTGDLGSDTVTTQALAQSGVGLASSLLGEAVSRSVEKRTSKLFGINRFQIDPLVGGSNTSARLTLGRQVNRNLSIIYSTNVGSGQEQVIQIEYRISNRFSVVATRDERGAFGLDFRVQKRF